MKKYRVLLMAILLTVFTSGMAYAVPNLQLDILNGYYDTTTQTTVSSGPAFTLRALLKNSDARTYYISAAVIPALDTSSSLGSFVFNGNTINVTGDMVYGNPPLETIASLQGFDNGDLSQHGVFPTYFSEFGFNFIGSSTVAAYDTQTDSPANGLLHYVDFAVDTSLLAAGYQIHFDLYDTKVYSRAKGNNPAGDIDADAFAPFSHDAESGKTPPVPEPATMLLLGSGLIGIAAYRRKHS